MNNKYILILSPQAWGKMMLAKHHYALELAKAGNTVYFLNPPDNDHWHLKNASERIWVMPSSEHPNLWFINQELYFPYVLKFHSRPVYNVLIKKQIRDILKVIGRKIDLLWSFDLGNLFPIKFFPRNMYKIFHPVDEPGDQHAISAASGAEIIFSVTNEIIEKYKGFEIPSFFINHGLADEFFSDVAIIEKNSEVSVGMSGNLLRQDLDRNILLQIIRENPALNFHFYGSYKVNDSNIGAGTDKETIDFIGQLTALPQVELHGVLKTAALARELNTMDMMLICYDIEKDQSRGTNYHKVMEYLSTGKVIVSNNITTYRNRPDLICMTEERTSNRSLPALFKETLANLRLLNSPAYAKKRIAFARANSYSAQLKEIDLFIDRTNQQSTVR